MGGGGGSHMKGVGMFVGNLEFNPFHMEVTLPPLPREEYRMISTLEHFKGAELECLSSR